MNHLKILQRFLYMKQHQDKNTLNLQSSQDNINASGSHNISHLGANNQRDRQPIDRIEQPRNLKGGDNERYLNIQEMGDKAADQSPPLPLIADADDDDATHEQKDK